jgi:hypothetical protein
VDIETETVTCSGTCAGVDIKLLLGSKVGVATFGVNFEWTIAWVRGRRRPEPRAETGKSVLMAKLEMPPATAGA